MLFFCFVILICIYIYIKQPKKIATIYRSNCDQNRPKFFFFKLINQKKLLPFTDRIATKKNFFLINLPTIWRPYTDHLLTNGIKKFWSANGLQMVGNYRPFGDHLPTNGIKKFWSANGLQMVGNYRPFGDHLPTKIFRLVNGR